MRDPWHLRELARRCSYLALCFSEPEAREQLRLWAVELANEAQQIEHRAECELAGEVLGSTKQARCCGER